ncbi:MAG: LysR family transcriptional regulator [Pseudomonadota bacterium]
MQIDAVETFLDLCETGSFNRTAERLGVTQSTVSGRVKALERALSCQLFERGRAGTALTTAGLKFEPHARTLRLTWSEAVQATRDAAAAISLRIGVQHDLLTGHIGDWITTLRDAVPDAAFYVESDFSAQMCSDVMRGEMDLAVVYTPTPHPDLSFESVGEVGYRMVSTEAASLGAVRPENYIVPNYSPAFFRTHEGLLPVLSQGTLSSGQTSVVEGLLAATGGTTYLPEDTVDRMAASGEAQPVWDAPRISQPVFAVLHLRRRHRPAYRRMVRALKRHIPEGRALG